MTSSDKCELKLKKNKKGGMKWKCELDLSGSDSEAEQGRDCSDTQCEAGIEVEADTELDDQVVEDESEGVEPEEEKEEEDA